jgi:hypothetical protein
MRLMTLLTAMLVAGCAGQPTSPATQTSVALAPAPSLPTAQAPAALAAAAAAGAAPGGAVTPDIESQRLAAARNLNLKVVNKDGQELYCRSNYMTGSHIQRDMQCYTAEQVQRLQEQTQRDLDQLNNRPNSIKGMP